MRLFTKLRAEQIATIAYPLLVVPDQNAPPASAPISNEVYPQTVRAKDGSAKVVRNQYEKNAALGLPQTQPTDVPAAEPEVQKVIITTVHRESYESPKSELLLSPKVAERKDPEGPIVGDWYVTDYDIQTDKVIRKVYDNETFMQYFKASLGG